MFNAQQVRALQQDSIKWLSFADGEITADNIEELRNILRFHEHRYYVENDPLISDGEYDIIYKKLQKFEEVNPGLVSSDSPTQRVGKGLIKSFPKVQHLVPMLSLETILLNPCLPAAWENQEILNRDLLLQIFVVFYK